jgi:hypothetical protein
VNRFHLFDVLIDEQFYVCCIDSHTGLLS